MSIEQKINYQLNKYPAVKKVIKRAYQRTMYAISPTIKSEGNITRISPDDKDHEYFFGYYDKSPWDITDRYMLCMKANNTWSDVSPKETADILLIDTEKNEGDTDRVKKIAETRAWNVQQSCMLQWLGPDFSSRVLYNDYRDGKYVSVILALSTMEEKVIPAPVYSVSADGKFALTLDFSRLYNLRPGYGYYNVPEKTKSVALPDTTAIWKVDLETGEVTDLLKYTDFANFHPRPEMKEEGSVHKVNHIMLGPNGKRFMVLYRWFIGERKYTRLMTCNVDGTDMYVLSDDDMVSHCFWKDDDHIIAFENKKKSGTGYYLMKDKTQEYVHCWPEMTGDGHPSYSPDRSLVVTDSYPDRARVASLRVMNADIEKNEVNVVARVFAPFKYDNDTRCDLHPRWNHAGDKICFDSVFEGHRGLYMIDINERHSVLSKYDNSEEMPGLVSCVIPTYKRCDTVTRAIDSVLAQTYPSIEVIVVDDNVPGDEYSLALQNVLRKYDGDSRVQYIQQKVHINGAVARNYGIRAAHGEYIALLDDDDEWLPEKLEKQLTYMIARDSDGCSCLYELYKDGHLDRRGPVFDDRDLMFNILSRKVQIMAGSSFICKRKAIYKSGMFDESFVRHQDLQMLVDFISCNSMTVFPEYMVRIHTDSTSNQLSANDLIQVKMKFLSAMDSRIKKLSKTDQKRVFAAHWFEIVFRALKEKRLLLAGKYILKIGINIRAYRDVFERFRSRKK